MDQISRKRLSGLECGQSGHVYAVVSADKRMRRHIVDMGITPGTEIKLVKLAPMGDPLEIELRGYTMSLRKADADTIVLMNEDDHRPCRAQTRGGADGLHNGKEHVFEGRFLPQGYV